MAQKKEGRFRFNGLADGACFAAVARTATGLEISPIRRVGAGGDAQIEVSATDAADGWSVYLRQINGAARVLHDAPTMLGAARALVAAERGDGLPVSLEAWDMRCEAGAVRELPAALRRALRRSVASHLRDEHPVYALATWIDLARHQAARRDVACADPGPGR